MPDNAFQYVIDAKGIMSEADYPYTDGKKTCQYRNSAATAIATGFTNITRGSETDLVAAIASVGPISVGIDSSYETFQLYKDGIYNEPQCSSTFLDEMVLVVGYGENETPYGWTDRQTDCETDRQVEETHRYNGLARKVWTVWPYDFSAPR